MANLWAAVCDAMASEQDRVLTHEAIRLMRDPGGVNKTGGPFGAVIARDGLLVAAAGNSVVKDLDPSAHAEVTAIRSARNKLGTWDFSDCAMNTSCECCPMCCARAYWAWIRTVFDAAAWLDCSDLFCDPGINEDMQHAHTSVKSSLRRFLRLRLVNSGRNFIGYPMVHFAEGDDSLE